MTIVNKEATEILKMTFNSADESVCIEGIIDDLMAQTPFKHFIRSGDKETAAEILHHAHHDSFSVLLDRIVMLDKVVSSRTVTLMAAHKLSAMMEQQYHILHTELSKVLAHHLGEETAKLSEEKQKELMTEALDAISRRVLEAAGRDAVEDLLDALRRGR